MSKRFREVLLDELEKPSANNVQTMRGRLLLFARSIRKKFGWKTNFSGISYQEYKQTEEDAATDVIVDLLHRYRSQLMSSHVTEKAAYKVLNAVRLWVKQRYAESRKREELTAIEIEQIESGYLFGLEIEETVEDFERLHHAGVIDIIEYYFLVAAYKGETTAYAAELLGWNESTARSVLFYARRKLQTYLENLENGAIQPKTKSICNSLRQPIDNERLYRAIRHIVER